MKIAVIGNYRWEHYQQALLDGFCSLEESRDSIPIKLDYYPFWNIVGVFQNTLKLFYAVRKEKPNAAFLYRVDYVFPIILKIIKKCVGTKILLFHNDDPYRKPPRRTIKHIFFLRSLKYSDITYVYRDINIEEAKKWGAPIVKLLRAYYYSKFNGISFPSNNFGGKQKRIVFIGHYEADSRIDYLDALFRAGVDIHIYGHDDWRIVFERYKWPITHLHPAVFGREYRNSLNSAYAALAFFSEKNRDNYTRRCFEIPMAHTLLIAPRTDYMNSTFRDGENAVLFSDANELVEKANEVLNNQDRTKAITEKGYCFVSKGGFSETDAARMIVSDIAGL